MQQTEETKKELNKGIRGATIVLLVVFVLAQISNTWQYYNFQSEYNSPLYVPYVVIRDVLTNIAYFGILTIISFEFVQKRKAPDWVVFLAIIGSSSNILDAISLNILYSENYWTYDAIVYFLYLVILSIYVCSSIVHCR